MAVDTPDMTQQEMEEILKGIIRDGKNGAARIAAIKELRAIQRLKERPTEGFAGLYEVSAPQRARRSA